ncbi:MAG: site-specific DNA-methyltransferase [Clostridiales bacterium]|nr:site-specific DNA-methyltransferase [Clostridiales bacterium]
MYVKLDAIKREKLGGEGSARVIIGDARVQLKRLTEECPGSASLIYMDPPFMTGQQFYAHMRVGEGGWKSGKGEIQLPSYADTLPRDEYLAFMRETLTLCREMLADDGLIFIHLDFRAAARVRVLGDEIFGENNFVNEIIWAYESGGRSRRFFARKHDVILLYAKTQDYDLHIDDAAALLRQDKKNHLSRGVDEDGRAYRYIVSGGKTYRYYEDEPVPPSDVWTDISHLQQRDPQRLGYDNQKPLKLLDRIVRAASRAGDLVLDPFCGAATALEAAVSNGRRFLGIDQCPIALTCAEKRRSGAGLTLDAEPSQGAPEFDVEIVQGITEQKVYLTRFMIDGTDTGPLPEGFDGLDGWAAGYVEGEEFIACDSETRQFSGPRLKLCLSLPMEIETPAVRLTDALGRRYFFMIR